MGRSTQQPIKELPKILRNPISALNLVWRRVFPFGIVPKDKETYRIGGWSYGIEVDPDFWTTR